MVSSLASEALRDIGIPPDDPRPREGKLKNFQKKLVVGGSPHHSPCEVYCGPLAVGVYPCSTAKQSGLPVAGSAAIGLQATVNIPAD